MTYKARTTNAQAGREARALRKRHRRVTKLGLDPGSNAEVAERVARITAHKTRSLRSIDACPECQAWLPTTASRDVFSEGELCDCPNGHHLVVEVSDKGVAYVRVLTEKDFEEAEEFLDRAGADGGPVSLEQMKQAMTLRHVVDPLVSEQMKMLRNHDKMMGGQP